ncbi:MAG TPA: hypothetical protein V6D20_15270, partial [Candidatus Obscuribacterales bacterium]
MIEYQARHAYKRPFFPSAVPKLSELSELGKLKALFRQFYRTKYEEKHQPHPGEDDVPAQWKVAEFT